MGFLRRASKFTEVDACLFGCGNYFGYRCAVLHLMITPKQGAASAGAAEGKNGSRRLLQQILEGCNIGYGDLRRNDGLVGKLVDASLFKPVLYFGKSRLVFFFAVRAIADDGFDVETYGFLDVGFGQLRGDIEGVGQFTDMA